MSMGMIQVAMLSIIGSICRLISRLAQELAAEAAIKRYKADPISAGMSESDLPDGVSLSRGLVVIRKD